MTWPNHPRERAYPPTPGSEPGDTFEAATTPQVLFPSKVNAPEYAHRHNSLARARSEGINDPAADT